LAAVENFAVQEDAGRVAITDIEALHLAGVGLYGGSRVNNVCVINSSIHNLRSARLWSLRSLFPLGNNYPRRCENTHSISAGSVKVHSHTL